MSIKKILIFIIPNENAENLRIINYLNHLNGT